jgi:kinesin family protein C2/C3
MHGTRSAEAAGSAQKRAALAASRRRVAADWVEELTGEALPTASDHAFRAALRDGVLLCRVLNTLRPGYISRVRRLERGAAGLLVMAGCHLAL